MDPKRLVDRTLAGLSRRELLRLAWTLGVTSFAQPVTERRLLAQATFSSYPFSLGVASGDPVPDGAVIWTRLAPKPLEGGGMPMAPVEVRWEVATDAGGYDVIQRGTTIARPELGHSVHVEVGNLFAGREYWYRFRVGGEASPIGRLVTAPAPGARVDRLRFGVCGCANWEEGFFTAYRDIADQYYDFVLFTGDYIYERRADGGRNENMVRQHQGDWLFTLVDYRNRYAQYKSDRDLRAAHASAPFIMTFDDHEVSDNYADAFDEVGTPPELFLLRRAAAYQAYYESMPLRASALPSGPGMRMYRRLQFGSLVDLTLLDTRQYRSDQACNDGFQARCAGAVDPQRTVLGAEQERWLSGNLAAAQATWTVIGQQVCSFERDTSAVRRDTPYEMDTWDGYTAARERLYNQIVETKAANPVILSGDVHAHYAAELKKDFRDPRSAAVGVEFTTTSISANGDGSAVTPEFEAIKADNPHIKHHGNLRGYLGCSVTPEMFRADFKVLDRVTVPGAPVRSSGAFVVEAGRPGCRPV
jgi:alkaline phosphatase D